MSSPDIDEKPIDQHIEDNKTYSKNADPELNTWQHIDDGFDPVVLKRTIRKVDFRIIPILSAMYAISLIDRNNVALARAANDSAINEDLGLDQGNRYSIITLVFFPTYIICEIPSQLGLRKFGPRFWLGAAVFIWGVIMLGMGFVKHWGELAALRAILGIPEAALFPGAAYIISCWYPRKSMATRTAIFYCISLILDGLAKPVMYCISLLDGRANYHGWRWIFIICGIVTVAIAFLALAFLPDFPDRAPFLTDEQRHIILTRIERDRYDSEPDKLTRAKFFAYLCEVKIWLFGIFFCSAALGAYSQSYFQPRILASIGFTNVESQLLTAPPPFWALIQSMVVAHLADKYRWRAGAVIVTCFTAIAGTAMYSQLPDDQRAARYAGLFLAYGGASTNVSLAVSWSQTSIRAQSKRGFSSAIIVAWGGIGGILAGATFIEKEADEGYPTGVWLTVALNAFVIVASVGLHFWFRYQNKRADRGEIILEGNADFRYQ